MTYLEEPVDIHGFLVFCRVDGSYFIGQSNGRIPMATNRVIYDNPVDAINKTRIKIFVADSYERVIPSFYIENNVEPIYNGGENQCVSYVTIAELIGMTVSGVPFEIADKDDTIFITKVIRAYLDYIESSGLVKTHNTSMETQEFVDNCKTVLQKLEPIQEKIKKHEEYSHIKEPETVSDLLKKLWS